MTRIKIHISNVKLLFYPPCEVKCGLQNRVSTSVRFVATNGRTFGAVKPGRNGAVLDSSLADLESEKFFAAWRKNEESNLFEQKSRGVHGRIQTCLSTASCPAKAATECRNMATSTIRGIQTQL